MKEFLVIVFLVGIVTTCQSLTTVRLFQHSNYGGESTVCSDLEDFSYCWLGHFNNKMTSYRIERGSCVIMYEENPPGGFAFWSDQDISNVGDEYNDKVSSMSSCGRSTTSVGCPEGTFVRTVEWANDDLRRGIRLHCMYPNTTTQATAVLYTHEGDEDVELPQKMTCDGVHGIAFRRDEQRETDASLTPVCRPGQSEGNTIMCGERQAIVGIHVEKENYSNQIKSSTLFCQDVGNIEEFCAPYDRLDQLFICDATQAAAPLKCTHAKRIGYGVSSSLSESERKEHIFYQQYGFNISYAGFGLSTNFEFQIGESEITGYDWTKTTGETWTEEVTITVEAEAPPGCRTTVTEVVGDCSFMTVRPSIFIRTDECVGHEQAYVTREVIPAGAHASKSFKFTSHAPKILLGKSSGTVPVPFSTILGGKNRRTWTNVQIVRLNDISGQ